MKKVVKETPKYVTEKTFEQSMRAITRSFERVDEAFERVNKALEIIVKEIRTIHEDNKYFRQSISGLNSDGISYDRKIENLTVRVEKLEAKI